jgi:GNAT superfamily N-acetyltransferase
MIRFVIDNDINTWLELSKEVEPLFGDMAGSADFKNGIVHCISASSALCVENDGREIEGIIAFDKAANEICWLAVRNKARSKGYGRQLLDAALGHLDRSRPVIVQTFAPDVKEGEAARKLYLRFGFVDFKDAGKNPAGVDTVIMVLKAQGQ